MDPRLKAGAEVLDLLASQDHFRVMQAKAKCVLLLSSESLASARSAVQRRRFGT